MNLTVDRAMSPAEPFVVRTAGDLEVAVMHEAHDLMASIIGPTLYRVAGEPGRQQASFLNPEVFALFAIRVGELISEARGNVAVLGAPSNLSLRSGLAWFAGRCTERHASDLVREVAALSVWFDEADVCRFWCGGVDEEFVFTIPRRQLWTMNANNIKHTFLRLQAVTKQLSTWASQAGHPVSDSEVLHILDSFTEWLDGYCQYHATMVAELIGRTFSALNAVIIERWEANGRSNDSRRIRHPEGASKFFQGLHTTTLVMRRYSVEKIAEHTPSTSPDFRQPYTP